MCRADVQPQARELLASVLVEIRDELCRREGVDPATVTCGPVDFGQPQHKKETHSRIGGRQMSDERESQTLCECGHEEAVHVAKGCAMHCGCGLSAYAVVLQRVKRKSEDQCASCPHSMSLHRERGCEAAIRAENITFGRCACRSAVSP